MGLLLLAHIKRDNFTRANHDKTAAGLRHRRAQMHSSCAQRRFAFRCRGQLSGWRTGPRQRVGDKTKRNESIPFHSIGGVEIQIRSDWIGTQHKTQAPTWKRTTSRQKLDQRRGETRTLMTRLLPESNCCSPNANDAVGR